MLEPDERNIWEKRYRELERTLTGIVRTAGNTMKSLEATGGNVFNLRKVVQHDVMGEKYLTCVADGSNLEYSFTFRRGGTRVCATKYQRSNSIRIAEGKDRGADECVVVVKTNDAFYRGKTLSAKVKI